MLMGTLMSLDISDEQPVSEMILLFLVDQLMSLSPNFLVLESCCGPKKLGGLVMIIDML
jgi:hypothetical protein